MPLGREELKKKLCIICNKSKDSLVHFFISVTQIFNPIKMYCKFIAALFYPSIKEVIPF